MTRGGALLLSCLGLGGVLACSSFARPDPELGPGGAAPVYLHNRADYERFRADHPEVLEPNYLPFMAWAPSSSQGETDWMLFCRWSRDVFPLAVVIPEPEIEASLQDEFRPTPPDAFVTAVRHALETWESDLEGLVTFRVVEDASSARLLVRLIGKPAPLPGSGVKVLGTTPLGDSCRVGEIGPDAASARVEFEVSELWIYIADEFGLLNADQIERIALHEIGHALGMRRHSPIPNDLMSETVREGSGSAGLSEEDVNSFLSLYALPNGTVYVRPPARDATPPDPRGPPQTPPRLAVAPHVDPGRGFEIQLPEGWLKVDTPTGLVAIDGVTWDYAASFQLIVRRYPSIDDYLARHAAAHVRGGTVLEQGSLEMAGRPAFRLVVESADGSLVDENTFIESGDGRLFVTIADCVPAECGAYRPWFEAALATLEIWGEEERGKDRKGREYRSVP